MKNFFVLVIALSFSLSLMAQDAHKNHNINYGIILGKTDLKDFQQNNRDIDSYNFKGLGFQYQYRPLNSINVFTQLEVGGGKLNDKENNQKYDVAHAEFDINLGYRFAANPTISVTPFIGRESYAAIVNLASTDLTTRYSATNLGLLLEFNPVKRLIVGFKPMIQFTDLVERDAKVAGYKVEVEYKNRTFYKLDVPVIYNFDENFGLFGALSYSLRKLEEKDAPQAKSDFNSLQVKVGLSHLF